MRDTFDIETIIYQALNVPDITNAISGKVYKNSRPLSSDKVDVVVGSLPVNNEQLQKTVVNVNVHVPNLKININGITDNTQPDVATLKTVTDLVISTLDDKAYMDYYFDVQQQVLFKDETTDEHYSNIRINFISENLN